MRALILAMTMAMGGAMAAPAAMAQGAPEGAAELRAGERDVVWARPAGLELQARVYPAEGATGAAPAIISVHGGGWSAGDRIGGAVYDRGLAAAGFTVIAIDFRMGADHPHPAASADVTAAVRWARLNAAELGVDPERIGLMGASSGGHLALLAALRPNAAAHLGTEIVGADGNAAAHDEIDASVDYVLAISPVADPLARFRYATLGGIDRITSGHANYFQGDEAAMLDASVTRIVSSGEAGVGTALPPVMVIASGADSNIPQEIQIELVRAYQSRDGAIEYAFYPGQPHVFGAQESEATEDMLAVLASFARRHGE